MSESKREAQRRQTRTRLYEASLQVFRRDGVQAARIDEIARLAGVSRASFYFHYPTKEHVLDELREASEDAFAAAILALPADATIETVFTTIAQAISTRWSDDPGLFMEVGLASLRLVTSPEQLGNPTGVRSATTTRFEQAQQTGALTRQLPASMLADLYLTQILIAALGWSSKPGLPMDAVLIAASGFFLHGVAARE